MKKQRLFVDMDGTLNLWSTTATVYDIHQKGYFLNRPVHKNTVAAVEILQDFFDVYALSAVLNNIFAIPEKEIWLNRHTTIKPDKRIFVPYGKNKSDYILDPLDSDILLDDFSVNLHNWHGIGIKVKNGINGTRGTWTGYEVNVAQDAIVIANTVIGVALAKEKVITLK